MKFIKENLTSILLAAIVVLLVLNWKCGTNGNVSYDAYKKEVEARKESDRLLLIEKDKRIEDKEHENVSWKEYIEDHLRQDSVLNLQIIANKVKYNANDKKLQDVVNRVNSLDRQQLLREYAEYQ